MHPTDVYWPFRVLGTALWSQGQDRASPCPEETYTMVGGGGEMSECIGDNIVSGHVSK